jgi:hypothetical protein
VLFCLKLRIQKYINSRAKDGRHQFHHSRGCKGRGEEIEQGLGKMVGGDGSVRVSLVDQGCCCHAADEGAGGQPTGSEHKERAASK